MSSESRPTVELTKALIRRRSVTPDDAGCQQLLRERLERIGFQCRSFDANGVSNLWAERGSGGKIICFAGHTDVVPPGPLAQWHDDPFEPVERNGLLYGRGAADMKSGVAAIITAIEAFVSRHPQHNGRIAAVFTSDEEGPSIDGTDRVVQWLEANRRRLDYVVVGEPSSVNQLGDTMKNGRRGSLSGRLTVHGKQGHVAYPQLGENALFSAAPAVVELANTRWDDGIEQFPPTSFQISNVQGGTGAENVIPGSVDMLFNFRHAPVSSAESLQQRMRDIVCRHCKKFDLAWTSRSASFFTRPGPLVDFMRAAVADVAQRHSELSCSGGTSDGRFLARVCDQVVELGPINATIHQVNEHVPIDNLEPLSRIYESIIERALQ